MIGNGYLPHALERAALVPHSLGRLEDNWRNRCNAGYSPIDVLRGARTSGASFFSIELKNIPTYQRHCVHLRLVLGSAKLFPVMRAS